MFGKQMEAAEAKNGTATPPGGLPLPALTNDDALMLVEYWRDQAKRNDTSWAGWYPIALRALGYEKEGDKFKIDAVHAVLSLPANALPLVWDQQLLPLSAKLDELQTTTKVVPSLFWMSKGIKARFVRVASAAWDVLRRERSRLPPPPVVPKLPRPGRAIKKAAWGALVVVVLVMMALGDRD
jgi:hypothetical protein